MHAVTDDFFIAPQIDAAGLRAAKDAGVTHVMMNRPDGEEPGIPTHQELAAEAKSLGLEFHYFPMVPGQLRLETIEEVATMLNDAEGKVLGFCKSGARSLALWALAGVATGQLTPEAALEASREAGFDLSGLAPLMTDLAREA